MAAPLIFITTYPIRDGKLPDLRRFLRELFEILEVNLPRALAVNAYISGNRSELAVVQVHQDAASLKEHWKVVHQHTGRDLEQFVGAPTSTQVYGDPGDLTLGKTRHSADSGSGSAMSVTPVHIGGFTRLAELAG